MFKRSLATRIAAALAVVVSLTLAPAAQTAKRPLAHADYDAWRSIYTPAVTNDGRYLAYSFMPQDGDGELIVRDLKTGQERREPVGALPPPPIPTADEVSDEPPAPRSVRILTTSDSRFVVATTFPSKAATEQAKRERKRADEMPKGEVLVIAVGSNQTTRLPAAKSVQVPSRGGSWLAYLKEGSPAPRDSNTPREGAARVEYGTDLVLRDLAQGTERVFANVLEFAFARDGKTLLYAVSSRTPEENGVYAVTPGSTAAPAPILSGKGKYSRLTWNRDQSHAVFTTDRDDTAAATPRLAVYRWQRGGAQATAIATPTTQGIPAGFVVGERGQLAFSRDGRKVYVPVGPPSRLARAAESSTDDRVLVDLWHWQDDVIQPMQRVRANQDRNRTYRGVVDLDSGKYVQLADTSMRNVSLSDDGTRAFGTDDSQYRRMVDYDGAYNDVYLVDTATGARKLVLKQLRGGGFGGGGLQFSPDGTLAFFYQDKRWHLFDTNTAAAREVTGGLGVAIHDEDDDTPDPPGSYGTAGWTSDSKSFLVYDRYDVWQIFADGRPAKNLTEGEGRRSRTEFRVQRIEAEDDEDRPRGLDVARPLYLRGVSEETRATGFSRTASLHRRRRSACSGVIRTSGSRPARAMPTWLSSQRRGSMSIPICM